MITTNFLEQRKMQHNAVINKQNKALRPAGSCSATIIFAELPVTDKQTNTIELKPSTRNDRPAHDAAYPQHCVA